MTLSIMALVLLCCVIYAECLYAECHYAEGHCAECHYAECRGALNSNVLKCAMNNGSDHLRSKPGNSKGGKYHCTIDLLFDWF